jgi:hypothetical protein
MSAPDYYLIPIDHDPFAQQPQDPQAWKALEEAAAARGMTVQQHLTDLMSVQRLAGMTPEGTA